MLSFNVKKVLYLTLLACFSFGGNYVKASPEINTTPRLNAVWSIESQIKQARNYIAEYSNNHEKTLNEFDSLTTKWHEHYQKTQGKFNIRRMLKAAKFSALKHSGQLRDGGNPYIVHPLGVCLLLWEIGRVRSTNVLVASLLHDTLEDTETTQEEIEELFGKRVLMTVLEVTDDQSLSGSEKKPLQVKHAPHMSLDAQHVKIADRINNLTDVYENPPASWSQQQIDNYFEWGQKLLNALNGVNEGLENHLQDLINKQKASRKS